MGKRYAEYSWLGLTITRALTLNNPASKTDRNAAKNKPPLYEKELALGFIYNHSNKRQ
jgi:hypothetical protein